MKWHNIDWRLTDEQKKLADENKLLAYKVASRMAPQLVGVDLEDVNQIALAGVCYAARNFDESRGTLFSTYAWRCIRGFLLTHFREMRLRKPVSFSDLGNHRSGDSDSDFGSLVEARDERRAFLDSKDIELLLSVLDARSAKVLRLRFIESMTLVETGQEMGGLSRERVRQIQDTAMARIRTFFEYHFETGELHRMSVAKKRAAINSKSKNAPATV